MFSFLIIKEERGILCLDVKGLSFREEGTLNIVLDVTSFNYISNINSFVLYNNYVLCELNIRGCRAVLKCFVIIDKVRCGIA